jgi:hypothetical protein
VRYELDFYIPEDDIPHSHRRASLKSYTGYTVPEWRLEARMSPVQFNLISLSLSLGIPDVYPFSRIVLGREVVWNQNAKELVLAEMTFRLWFAGYEAVP